MDDVSTDLERPDEAAVPLDEVKPFTEAGNANPCPQCKGSGTNAAGDFCTECDGTGTLVTIGRNA